jgi:hypothetical protein
MSSQFSSSLKDSNFRTARLGPRPARPSCAPTAERPPAPHACSTRLAVLSVCCWDWRCGSSTWRCCEQPPCVRECVEKTIKCCCPCITSLQALRSSAGSCLAPRPARPTAERPPAPHACSTRLAVLRVCCWSTSICGDWLSFVHSLFGVGGPLDFGTPCGTPEQVKHFRGPCAACCKPLAPCFCVSADGEAIFGCVPTDRNYYLPACLHMALCPQLGCDPRGGVENMPNYLNFLTAATPYCVQLKFRRDLW